MVFINLSRFCFISTVVTIIYQYFWMTFYFVNEFVLNVSVCVCLLFCLYVYAFMNMCVCMLNVYAS